MEFSSLLGRFQESATLRMAQLSRELQAKGANVISLSLGEPDFNTPDHIKNAAKKAIDENYSHYTPVPGYMEARKAVVEKLKRDNHLDYAPEQIVLSTGAKQSIANIMMAMLEPGKEIIIPTPYWVSYSDIANLTGGEVVFIHAKADRKFKITPGQLENAITSRTRLFIFSSPCNPTGSVYTRDELEGLARVFEKHPEIFIISDEIYEFINYSGQPHQSIAQFDFIKDRVILINGLSKAFAMTGWRLGYIAAHKEVVKAAQKIQGQFTSGTNSITQRAAIAALTESLEPTFEMVRQFEIRKKRVMELIKTIPLMSCIEPDGAFYVFPDVHKYFGKKAGDTVINDSNDLSMYLLNNAHVSTVGGSAFGSPDNIRLSFANSLANIEEAFKRMKEQLDKLV
jgi:aspartate aminotransferase